jgi:FKBP-type peptidyl-prolyl cis-trans isomerase (trigger factor)
MKEAASRLNLYKYYIPLIVSAISESIKVDSTKLEQAFTELAEKHVKGEITGTEVIEEKEDEITGKRLEEEAEEAAEIEGEMIKPDREQIALNAARKKDKMSKARSKKKEVAIPETLRKDADKKGQRTLDTVIDDKPSKKGRKSK